MREGKLQDRFGVRMNFDFGNRDHRGALVLDSQFTYGHFRIGHVSKCDPSYDYRLKNPVGYATVGGLRRGDKLYYGVSMCSPEDNFSKKTGRRLVVEHLLQEETSNKRGVLSIAGLTNEQPALLLKFALERHIFKTRNLPSWTKKGVHFRSSRRMLKLKSTIETYTGGQTVKVSGVGSFTIMTPQTPNNPVNPARREAALKAWETRRRNGRQ